MVFKTQTLHFNFKRSLRFNIHLTIVKSGEETRLILTLKDAEELILP